MIALSIVLAVVLVIAAVVYLIDVSTRPKSITSSTGSTPVVAPTVTPPARPTPAPPCPTQGKNWFGGFWKFVVNTTKVVIVVGILCGLAFMIYLGIRSLLDDSVVVKPSGYTEVSLHGCRYWKFILPYPTATEYIGLNGQPVPVIYRGRQVYEVVSGPGNIDQVMYEEPVVALRFSSVSPAAGEYSFTFKKW